MSKLRTFTADTITVSRDHPVMIASLSRVTGERSKYWQVANLLGLFHPLQTGLTGGLGHEAAYDADSKTFTMLDVFQNPQAAAAIGDQVTNALQQHGLTATATATNLAVVQRLEQEGRADRLRELAMNGELETLRLVMFEFIATPEKFRNVADYVGDRLPFSVLDNTVGRLLSENFEVVLNTYWLVDLVQDLPAYEAFLVELKLVLEMNLRLVSRQDIPIHNIFLAEHA